MKSIVWAREISMGEVHHILGRREVGHHSLVHRHQEEVRHSQDQDRHLLHQVEALALLVWAVPLEVHPDSSRR